MQYIYSRNEDYFLPDPEFYIFKNWCSDPDLQLLARPVSQSEYPLIACVTSAYFDLGLTSVDPPTCRIVAKTGQTVIKFGLPPASEKKLNFSFSLYRSKYSPERNAFSGVPLGKFSKLILEKVSKSYPILQIHERLF